MELTQQIHDMVDILEEQDKLVVAELLKKLVPDNVATKQDLLDIAMADEEYAKGETISIDCL